MRWEKIRPPGAGSRPPWYARVTGAKDGHLRRRQHIRVTYISYAQVPRDAWLVDTNATAYPVTLTLVSGAGVGVPLGSPRPPGVDDQLVASARLGALPDYLLYWPRYHLVVELRTHALNVAAPGGRLGTARRLATSGYSRRT
jgi:hypothetical protein